MTCGLRRGGVRSAAGKAKKGEEIEPRRHGDTKWKNRMVATDGARMSTDKKLI